MTTTIEAAKALESFGWALVKYAQRVQAGNVKGAHDWWLRGQVRWFTFRRLRKEAWGIQPSRKFKAGLPPNRNVAVDVFCVFRTTGRQGIYRACTGDHCNKDYIALHVKSWRYAV